MHLAGGSLREIADALSLSHQRVQQIVSEAGGSWWGRVWRGRNRRDAVCTWCDRPPSEVSQLVAGPNVYICDACVAAAEGVIGGGANARGTVKRAKTAPAHRCSFCYKRGSVKRQIAVGPANVCSECLQMCREILDGRTHAVER